MEKKHIRCHVHLARSEKMLSFLRLCPLMDDALQTKILRKCAGVNYPAVLLHHFFSLTCFERPAFGLTLYFAALGS